MINRMKNLLSDWRTERERSRELHAKLEALTDPTFLDRALAE